MRKLMLDVNELQVESFRTTAGSEPQRGTVRGQEMGSFLDSSGDEGYSSGHCVCNCDTTYTQRPPHCDPSANTYCVGIEGVCDQTLLCA